MTSNNNLSLRQLINLVDGLRDIGLHKYVNLPRICVAGTQSSGKSSVLESIVGIDLLPRGDGIVTRRPIEFRLSRLPSTMDDGAPSRSFVLFEGNEKKFYDFDEVREHIQELTNQIAGCNKGIVDDPIVLSVYSPDSPDLSLIDLPGVTRVPLKNSDQTDDIEVLTKDMIMRYASDPRTIILAVVAANVDMSTSDALQLARKADPSGVRTLGVITKIDLMDRGANAASMLQNEEVKLRLGYTGVKNRSQHDIANGVTIKEALQNEKEYFSQHKVYRHLSPSLWGIESLIDKLTKVLYRHISAVLPEIKNELATKMKAITTRLDTLGACAPTDSRGRMELLWQMITDYCDMFSSTIKGKYVNHSNEIMDRDIITGVQIRAVFNELLESFVSNHLFDQMSDYDIDQAIQIHEGDSLPGFPSPDTFEYLMLPQLQKLGPPILDCLDKVYAAMELLAFKLSQRVFGRFPTLCDHVLTLSQNIFAEERDKTRHVLEQYIECETSYIFTNDAQYIMNVADEKSDGNPKTGFVADKANQISQATSKAITGTWDAMQGKKSRYGPQFIQEIRRRLNAYFTIVLRNVRDSVPKMIGHFLVRRVQKNMHYKIYTALNQHEDLSLLFGEPSHIAHDRILLKEQHEVLTRALGILQRDFAAANRAVDLFDETFDSDLKKLNTAQTTSTNVPMPISNTTLHNASAIPQRRDYGNATNTPPLYNQQHPRLRGEPVRRKVLTNPLFD